MHTNYKTN